jgi:hypothetical protein
MWTSGDLAISQLTPMFMPVSVMHDFRNAVGVIADTRLRTPDANQVPRAKIENALALWAHRFPEAVEEAHHNYRQGTLMQSMECVAPSYDCATCGMSYMKLPRGGERANWCSHLKAEDGSQPVRILRNVVFTGTGLIFGSRGAQGADPSARLETFQQEVAEFHERVHRDTVTPRRKRRMENIEIPKSEYDELRARPAKTELDAAVERAEKAEKDLETAEAEKAKTEEKVSDLEAKVTAAEEKAQADTLREERLGKLGKGFVAKLGDKTKDRLRKDASAMQDDEWTARLEELEEAYGVKADADETGGTKTDADKDTNGSKTFTAEEIARFQGSSEATTPPEDSPAVRRSVVAGLFNTKK